MCALNVKVSMRHGKKVCVRCGGDYDVERRCVLNVEVSLRCGETVFFGCVGECEGGEVVC
jgi:hypothetical protein